MKSSSNTDTKEHARPSASGGDTSRVVDRPWAVSVEDLSKKLDVNAARGLTAREVTKRRRQYGPNLLREAKRRSVWRIVANQFESLVVVLLVVAAVVSFAFGEWLEGTAIAAVIAVNAAIGFVTELKAVRSMEALHQLSQVSAKVRRDGQVVEIAAENIVPGDVVVVEGGDVVTADLRLTEASNLQVDESALTGESVPVAKQTEKLPEDTPLADRKNMLFKGTAVTRGAGEGAVAAIGMQTELGKISSLAEEAEAEKTPLEKRLDQLGHRLLWLTLAIAAAVSVSGSLAGKEIFLMIETGIALAVAAVPEGLPIVATIALARGMWRMARRNAIVNRLSAVETLGATTIICTDKTGTLTENRMTVSRIDCPSGQIELRTEENEGAAFIRDGEKTDPLANPVLRRLLQVGALCNNAQLSHGADQEDQPAVGDPLEIALLEAAAHAELHRDDLLGEFPEIREEAFDPDVRMMATIHESDEGFLVAVKGAPESALDACARIIATEGGEQDLPQEERRQWLQRSDAMAEQGLRVLALAAKTVDSAEVNPYEDLTFLGLAGLSDPPRTEVRDAITTCRGAGIRVVMVTGDQPATARQIASAVRLVENSDVDVIMGQGLKGPDQLSEDDRRRLLRAPIFARVSPRQKLDLVGLYQAEGDVVAMTGDGVNDAPALKKADIGVAMGRRGTQVASEAADMVLKDDAFSTIVAAVAQGRVIFQNIRKFVFYLLSCNVSEVMTVGLASLANAPLPVLPLQILFLNVVTDVFPALALGAGEGNPGLMQRPPRNPKEGVLTQKHWLGIGGYGSLMTAAVLGAFAIALLWLDMSQRQAVTVSFLTLAFAQLWHVFNMRDRGSKAFRNDVVQNPFVWAALALCTGLLLTVLYVPVLAAVLGVTNPGVSGWIVVLGMSFVPCAIGQVLKSVRPPRS